MTNQILASIQLENALKHPVQGEPREVLKGLEAVLKNYRGSADLAPRDRVRVDDKIIAISTEIGLG